MPRTEVYQLRLTPEEKEQLTEQAHSKGCSIATMIRDTFGIAPNAERRRALERAYTAAVKPTKFDERLEKNGFLKKASVEELAQTQTWAEAQVHDEAIAKTINGELLNELTQKLKNQGYTTPVAERMARKQLGA